jgi:hypothetical protein
LQNGEGKKLVEIKLCEKSLNRRKDVCTTESIYDRLKRGQGATIFV